MSKTRLFTRLVRWLGREEKKPGQTASEQSAQAVVNSLPSSPTASTASVPSPKPPKSPKSQQPSKSSIPSKSRQKKVNKPVHQRKSRQTHEPKIDKKGFRVLNDRHDLHRLFGGEDDERFNRENDFASMFEESQDDIYQKRLMKDKKQAEYQHRPRTQKPPSVKIKTYPPPQKELDLHGYTGDEAEIAAGHFIQDARQKRIQTVRIIVGKGLHSEGKAVLPDIIERMVIGLKRQNQVIAYHWEKKDKRKSGAVIVYLV